MSTWPPSASLPPADRHRPPHHHRGGDDCRTHGRAPHWGPPTPLLKAPTPEQVDSHALTDTSRPRLRAPSPAASKMVIMSAAFRLDGRQALLSGAGRAPGRAIADTLAELGAVVHGTSRDQATGEQIAERYGTAPLTLDMADIVPFPEVVDALEQTVGSRCWSTTQASTSPARQSKSPAPTGPGHGHQSQGHLLPHHRRGPLKSPRFRSEVRTRRTLSSERGCRPSRPPRVCGSRGGQVRRAFGSGASPFRSALFQDGLTRRGLTGSMGPGGSAGDTAAMESFFGLLQKYVLDRGRWAAREELCGLESSPGLRRHITAGADRTVWAG